MTTPRTTTTTTTTPFVINDAQTLVEFDCATEF